jgi:hypothetical protein
MELILTAIIVAIGLFLAGIAWLSAHTQRQMWGRKNEQAKTEIAKRPVNYNYRASEIRVRRETGAVRSGKASFAARTISLWSGRRHISQ